MSHLKYASDLDRKIKKPSPLTKTASAAASVAPVSSGHGLQANTNLTFDLAKLGEPSCDVESYVRTLLQKLPNEDSVQQLYRSMADSRDVISQELQRNVYRNYNEFVVISKEISKLEGDMISVRRVLGELKDVRDKFGMYGQEGTLSPTVPVAEEKKVLKPEEIAKQKARDEAEMEARVVAMKAMYKEIEGLQKALPELPSRELLLDGTSVRIFEINASTYKQKDLVFIHVVSDAVVIAVWKKNMMSGKNRLVVEKWFAINEIGFIDMKDSPDMMNAFKILKGSETFMFRAETLQEKRTLLNIITKITSDLVAQKKLEITMAKSPVSPSMPATFATLAAKTPDGKRKAVQDGLSDADYRWLLELSDELDVLIAQRDFGQAVSHVEKARLIMSSCSGETPRLSILRSNIEERVTTLSRLVSMDLTSPAATKTQIQEDIKRLQRLGLGDQARDIYLSSRSNTIKHRLRQLQFNGDIVSYMIDYSEIFFRLIKNTCEWFEVSFHDPSMASGFMKWIHEELVKFTVIFKKQTFGMRHEFHVMTDCIVTATERCQELNSIGMDITATFENLIKDELIAAIEQHTQKCDLEIHNSIQSDVFELLEPNLELFESAGVEFSVPIPQLSQSGVEFYERLTKFGSDIGMLMSFTLYNTIVSALGRFFLTFANGLKVAVEKPLEVSQYIAIMTNVSFVVEHIFKTTAAQLTDRFERPIPELEREGKELEMLLAHIRARVIGQIQSRVISVEYNFAKIDYSSSAEILDNILPSPEMVTMVRSLRSILLKSSSVLNAPELISDLLLQIFTFMDETQACWNTPKGPRKFGFGGVQAFILDMHFLLHAFDEYVSEKTNDLSNSLCERALRHFFTQNKDLAAPLKPEEFYDRRVLAAMKEYGLQ
ncbi:exocyst complex component exo84 [Kappamyces sp. JEL0680]|nr:exocyst complex component exo84 [Kappamyces sp. JEL0680]